MKIVNGSVFTADGIFENRTVTINDGIISAVDSVAQVPMCPDVIDATGLYVIPGLVDIHLHGCMGHDFCDGTAEAFDTICKYELSQGVTSITPATMTISPDKLRAIFSAAGRYSGKYAGRTGVTGATIRGITMEGPFISAEKKGAQNGEHIMKPDISFFRKMQELCGAQITQVAIAPENDKGYDFIRTLKDEVVCSVAHSAADYNTAKEAFINGATHVTHLYNGMNPMTHRSPGIIGAAYENKDVFVELITDGIHVDPVVVKMTFELFGAKRICMISDSIEATGLEDGDYSLGGQAVHVKGHLARLSDGTIAGSVSSLYDCLKTAVNFMNIPLEDAIMSCTLTPAKSIGIDNICGCIEVGKAADIVLLDKDLNIVRVIKS